MKVIDIILEQFAKLIYDYDVNNKIVDFNFIDQVIEIFVNEKELDNYVRSWKVDSGINDMTMYDFSARTILVNR